jgi:hypothetical protein
MPADNITPGDQNPFNIIANPAPEPAPELDPYFPKYDPKTDPVREGQGDSPVLLTMSVKCRCKTLVPVSMVRGIVTICPTCKRRYSYTPLPRHPVRGTLGPETEQRHRHSAG